LLFFLEKEAYHENNCSWGQAPKPPGSASPSFGLWKFSSTKQNNAFCFFFWKKKDIMGTIACQTPRVGFAEFWVWRLSSAKQNYAFCFFFWKKKKIDAIDLTNEDYWINCFLGGTPTNPEGRLRRVLGMEVVFCEAELRFLLLFLEKEVY
jgi:hypothetical protein